MGYKINSTPASSDKDKKSDVEMSNDEKIQNKIV